MSREDGRTRPTRFSCATRCAVSCRCAHCGAREWLPDRGALDELQTRSWRRTSGFAQPGVRRHDRARRTDPCFALLLAALCGAACALAAGSDYQRFADAPLAIEAGERALDRRARAMRLRQGPAQTARSAASPGQRPRSGRCWPGRWASPATSRSASTRSALGMTPRMLLHRHARRRGGPASSSPSSKAGTSASCAPRWRRTTALTQRDATLSTMPTLMARSAPPASHPEGRFLPETYVYTRGTQRPRRCSSAPHAAMDKALAEAWATRDARPAAEDARRSC